MPPKRSATQSAPRLTRTTATGRTTSTNGTEQVIDPDAPREGRLATLAPRTPAARGAGGAKITFKPKAVQRRRKDGAPESLLSLGEAGDEEAHASGSRLRRQTEHGRGRGSRVEAPLTASGPFAQGPAIASIAGAGRGRGRRGGGETPRAPGGASSAPQVRMATGQVKEEGRGKQGYGKAGAGEEVDGEEELNYDDAGQPMQNLLRMRQDGADFWAPITTERIERTTKENVIAAPGEESKLVRVKREPEDSLGFIDVKTESTLTSRMPTPEQKEPDQEADEDDIALPMAATPAETKVKQQQPQVKKEKKQAHLRVMTAEEADEQERFSADLDMLRLSLTQDEMEETEEEGKLLLIQLPEVLPLWAPHEDTNPEQQQDQQQQQQEEGTQVKQDQKKKKKKQKPTAFPAPEGCVGQLHLHQSGRMSCVWGGIAMEVGSGSECGFLQQIIVCDENEKKVFAVGQISAKMLLTPNLDALL